MIIWQVTFLDMTEGRYRDHERYFLHKSSAQIAAGKWTLYGKPNADVKPFIVEEHESETEKL